MGGVLTSTALLSTVTAALTALYLRLCKNI